jgi:hypothetical protein
VFWVISVNLNIMNTLPKAGIFLSGHPVYRMSQEKWIKPREIVPFDKIYRYNPKHLSPKINGYGDNGQRKVWSSLGFHALYMSAENFMHARP